MSRSERLTRMLAPLGIGILLLALWQAAVAIEHVPAYILPGPAAIADSLWRNGPSLLASLWITFRITMAALLAAAGLGLLLAIAIAESRWVEIAVLPYAVALQVTPIVAIAPLIIIWVGSNFFSLLICAWLVAFFPVVANTTLGLKSADHNLRDLFLLYGATRWQRLWRLRLPTALPYFLSGLRISGGLALIGAVVAEFVAGTGGAETGIAFRILEAGYRLEIAKMFAALVLLALTGIAIYGALGWLNHWLLRHWHESVLRREP